MRSEIADAPQGAWIVAAVARTRGVVAGQVVKWSDGLPPAFWRTRLREGACLKPS